MDPQEHHAARLELANADVTAVRHQLDRLAQLRGVTFLSILLLAWVAVVVEALPAWTIAVPAVGFVALVLRYLTKQTELDQALARVELHQTSLERMAGRWPGTGPEGSSFKVDGHPYQTDLDILGSGSLFQLLCAAQTLAGQATLADWLMAPSDPTVVHIRQGAVAELVPQVEVREAMALTARGRTLDIDPIELRRWALQSDLPTRRRWQLVAGLASTLMATTLWGWAAWGWPAWSILASLIASYVTHGRIEQLRGHVLKDVQTPAGELSALAKLLTIMERQPGRHDHLQRLHGRLTERGLPSVNTQALARAVERVDWERNLLFAPLAGLLLWRAQCTLWIDGWRSRHGADAVRWLELLGEYEALHSLARHAFEHPEDISPEVVEGAGVDATGLAHPFLAGDVAVANDITLGHRSKLLMVSGSNMSGKSTLLRAIGTNVVLALAGSVVRATSMRVGSLQIAASIRSEDSLLAGSSRFRAELDRMRVVLDLSAQSRPILFLLDEIFHGTHSHDRRLGAQAFLTRLVDRGGIGLVTTHDLALTELSDGLDSVAANVHFEDQIVEGSMTFDYRMRPGVVTRSNALQLMAAEGLIDLPEEASGGDPQT